jgi:hypothetical protein
VRPLALLLAFAALAAAVPSSFAAKPVAKPRLARAIGPISRLTRTHITVGRVTCIRAKVSPVLRGLGLGDRVAIICRSGTLTEVGDLRPPPRATGTVTATASGSGSPPPAAPATTAPPTCPERPTASRAC